MKNNKLFSIAAAVSISAVSFFAISASASAETETHVLSYVDTSNAAVTSVVYDENKNFSKTYSLDEESIKLLENSKAGDTLKISYKVSANDAERYRAGLKLGGVQFYVNSVGSSIGTGINKSFLDGGNCHFNANLSDGKPAEIEIEYELNNGGTAAKVIESKVTDADNNSFTYTEATTSKLPYSLNSTSLSSLVFNSADRGNGKPTGNKITLSEFKAELTNEIEVPAKVSEVTAAGDTVHKDGENWYAKTFKFDVTPGTNPINSITVSIGDKYVSKDFASLSGETAYECGIIIGSEDENKIKEVSESDINVDAKYTSDSILAGKNVYAFGDSIVYGHNKPEQSFMRLISDDYKMNLQMYAVNGASVVCTDSVAKEDPAELAKGNYIINQINKAPADAPDAVIFDGYTNDAYGDPSTDSFNSNGAHINILEHLGTIQGNEAVSFDDTTYCGAFEHILYTMKNKWPNTPIIFTTIHKSGGRDFDIQSKLRELSIEMCQKWGVTVADVFNDTALDTRDASQMASYIINGAGSHPNESGCREFYMPVVVEALNNVLSE